MKKIGIYDPYLDDVGGGEKYMLSIAQILSKDNDVSVFWDDKNGLDEAIKRFDLDLSRVKLDRNIFSPNISAWSRMNISKNYDSIVFLSDGSLPWVRSKLFVHFQRPLEHVHPNFLTSIKVSRVKTFFCNSKYTKSYIDKTFRINSKVIYPPVSLEQKDVEKENIILHVGRFRVVDREVGAKDFKKQYIMLQVFKNIVDEGLKKWRLVMGVSIQDKDKEAFEEMKRHARGYPIEFEINKSNSSLWNIYSRAKIYWHASGYGENLIKYPELAEHFGISTVEAMGAGAVPVVINLGGQKEIVTDGENGFTWKTLEEFQEKTFTLIKSPKLLNEMSDKARARAQDFTQEKFDQQILEMIR